MNEILAAYHKTDGSRHVLGVAGSEDREMPRCLVQQEHRH